jgi:Fic family protein
MDIKLFTRMIGDKHYNELSKMKYKYGAESLKQYIDTLQDGFYKEISLTSFEEKQLVYLPSKIQITAQRLKIFMQRHEGKYSISAMEEEIASTLSIEHIETSRDSIRDILNGSAPKDENDKKVYGIKLGLDFISNPDNHITEENLHVLYMLAAGDFVKEKDRLLPGHRYRHDKVYVAGNKPDGTILHEGLAHQLLPAYIKQLIHFINADDGTDDIIKSMIAHYYFVYLHPYFDGNGRTARLLQMWVLIQKGYASSLFLPFSMYINESRTKYYKTFELIAENYKLSKQLDVTPFLEYFIENVVNKLSNNYDQTDIINSFNKLVHAGEITEKEKELFHFVLSNYGLEPFSTKQLEKDYRDVAYATVRSFVLKLEAKGILTGTKYSNRVKYQIRS